MNFITATILFAYSAKQEETLTKGVKSSSLSESKILNKIRNQSLLIMQMQIPAVT